MHYLVVASREEMYWRISFAPVRKPLRANNRIIAPVTGESEDRRAAVEKRDCDKPITPGGRPGFEFTAHFAAHRW